ncbi:Hsp20/alpha crystallin family protein [Miltoncostaea oceani]|jgi:HSP20 family protein|uniref:Hsp20/alpha crystallin family protein n=1 Tax=Miltoncostaea oceani TaxID=2843216 RepID=UPI001C3C5780|nr:Hsp20/alpha crystallin family protein [Miltoncostaea oceani]
MPPEIVRWDPFRDVMSLRSDIDRLMGTLAGNAPRSSLPARWAPSADVIEREDEIVVTAELPGVADKDVEVTVDEGVLRISGARELTEEVDDERFHRIERSYGGFERTFPLPAGVDPDSIRAGIAYGVLKVTIPKPAAPTPRRIAVNPAGD